MVLLTACASEPRVVTEYVPVQIECTVPELHALPMMTWGEINGTEDALDRLEQYEAALVDSLIEHRDQLTELCGNPEQ